jgi:hypothetical protein
VHLNAIYREASEVVTRSKVVGSPDEPKVGTEQLSPTVAVNARRVLSNEKSNCMSGPNAVSQNREKQNSPKSHKNRTSAPISPYSFSTGYKWRELCTK